MCVPQQSTVAGWLEAYPPEDFGLAISDGTQELKPIFGFANDLLSTADSRSTILSLVDEATQSGFAECRSGPIHLLAGKLGGSVSILMIRDKQWEASRLKISILEQEADALRRIGKALTMNQTLEPTAMQAAHAISGALDLATTMLWFNNCQTGTLDLIASVGLNREGTLKLRNLNPNDEIECLGHLVAISGSATWLNDVSANDLTKGAEGTHCYMQPGAACAIPLKAGYKTIGILEMVAKAGDKHFPHAKALHITIAEHLALALNSAVLFENTERMATTDPLTGIANHRTMQEYLLRVCEDADKEGSSVGLVMVDVDHFRKFNEEEGHECGDEVLRLVASVLRDSVPDGSLAARYGGEEFTIIVPGSTQETITKIAENARNKIENLNVSCKSGESRRVTASFGCSLYPEADRSATGALKAADGALYEAKRTGRNRVAFASADTARPATKSREVWEAALANVPPAHASEARSLVGKAEKHIRLLVSSQVIEADEIDQIKSALVLWSAWQSAVKSADAEVINAIQSELALKTVLTWLQSSQERWDGNGPLGQSANAIPLGTRIVTALMAAIQDETGQLSSDPGRFDPEIVAILTTHAQAA